MVTFVNELKEDAAPTITSLSEALISTKMITGDNVFLGVKTALMVGIVPPHSKVVVVEGKRNSVDITELVFRNEKVEEKSYQASHFEFSED